MLGTKRNQCLKGVTHMKVVNTRNIVWETFPGYGIAHAHWGIPYQDRSIGKSTRSDLESNPTTFESASCSKGSNSTPLKSRVFIAYKRFLAYPYLAVYGQWLQLIKTHERLFLTKQERENLDTSLSVER
jgi:hypothetical protein